MIFALQTKDVPDIGLVESGKMYDLPAEIEDELVRQGVAEMLMASRPVGVCNDSNT